MAYKILVVDDEPIFVEAFKRALIERKHEVVTAVDGQEALEKVQNEQPDLIALDVIMPRMNGYEFIRALNAQRTIDRQPEIPIIVLTAKEEMRGAFKSLGVEEYLVKPLEFPHLVQKIENYLGAHG